MRMLLPLTLALAICCISSCGKDCETTTTAPAAAKTGALDVNMNGVSADGVAGDAQTPSSICSEGRCADRSKCNSICPNECPDEEEACEEASSCPSETKCEKAPAPEQGPAR